MGAQPLPPSNTLRQTLLCSRFHPERYGGVEERLWHATRALVRNGLDLTVITENRVGAPAMEVIQPRLTIRRLPPVDAGRLWRWYFAVQAYHWYTTVMKHAPPGTIWASDPTMAVGALFARPRRPVVFNPAACAAGMRHIWEQRPDVYSMKVPRHLVWLDRLAYRGSDVVVVSSANIKRQFERFYGPKSSIEILPYGRDSLAVEADRVSARQQFCVKPDAFCIGFVGRLDPCKDIPFLLAAFKAMGPSAEDRLLIGGVGADEARLRRITAESGLDGHVMWTGWLDSPQTVLAAMDVLVLPSVYEAFGLVLLEAMAVGVPVIARADDGQTVFTASSEIVTPLAGAIVSTISELASVLNDLKTDPRKRARLGEGAKRAVQSRTWDDYAVEAIAILRRVAAPEAN